jgi:hypothetical protein
MFPMLLQSSPNLQAIILTPSPAAAVSALVSTLLTFPIVEAQGKPANHFLKLGLLNPLGSGKEPLDAIIVLDPKGKRRLVLPFGWGVGTKVDDCTAGGATRERFLSVLGENIKDLEQEKTKNLKDFYEVARTYF